MRSEEHQPIRADGFVALVGAGPGDPELMTLKAARHLERADVILKDALVSDACLEWARDDARIVDVGKLAGGRHTPQAVTNALLIDEALAGRYVVRLKGGDPLVFGRGGEEALALEAAGVAYELVPGISSAIAVPAAAGVPVTHRGVARHVTIVTGSAAHDDDIGAQWSALAQAGGTLVFLMARRPIACIVEHLRTGGLSSSTPALMVQAGTRADGREVRGTLATIVDQVETAEIGSPALLVVGEVVDVGLRSTLATALGTQPENAPPKAPAPREENNHVRL